MPDNTKLKHKMQAEDLRKTSSNDNDNRRQNKTLKL